jgi:hypothetical protein
MASGCRIRSQEKEMKNEQENMQGSADARRWTFPLAVAACWLAMGLWITGQSLWLDEGMAVSKSLKPTFAAFWESYAGTRASDLQQPLFILSQWLWVRFSGWSEWGVRAMNWAWMAVAFGYAATRPQWNRRVRLLWCALAAVSPFMAMYMDEAKGYIMHFAAGTLLFLSIAGAGKGEEDKFDFGAFSLGLLLTCGTSLTGVLYAAWAGTWLLACLLREKRLGDFLRGHRTWVAVDAAGLAVLGGWYVHTLLAGARAAALKVPFLSSTAFLAYEWLGFSGVGPARLVMRGTGVRAAIPFLVPLAVHAAAVGFFAFEWIRVWRGRVRAAAGGGREGGVPGYAMALIVGMLGVASLLAAGRVTDLAIRGRHLIVVFPAALLAVAVWAERMLMAGRRAPRAAVAVLLAAMAVSSLALRFGERHGKENYRRATAIALEALKEGQCVWWSADGNTASVYGMKDAGAGHFALCLSPTPEYLAEIPPPDVVFVNRPDTWDGRGHLARYIAEHGMRLEDEFIGFRIYRPAGGESAGSGP